MVNKLSDLKAMRHSTEHVLTQAVLKLYPGIKMAMGPATQDGFYFDFDTTTDSGKTYKITESDFPEIEKEMKSIISRDLPIKQEYISLDEAKKIFKDNQYKLEWLKDIKKRGEKVSIFKTGDEFKDLCAGPHVRSTGKIGSFKLLSVAGAYWKGSEKNKMLTRIYGTAFFSKKELYDYIKQQEEAKEYDHRKIGKEMDLFIFSDLIGSGLPLFTEKGATIRRELERFTIDEEIKRGYKHVVTPVLAKTDLYRVSGHYPYYKDTMYPPMKVDEDELILRPMTCPHHFMLYKSRPRSYRELPLRIAEMSPQFRYEKSGELSGLMRVRVFCLADAHIFASVDQAESEIMQVLNLIDYINETLGLKKGVDYLYRLSLGDIKDDKKYYKDDKAWIEAEEILRNVLKKSKSPYYEAKGEAAFYGPKIDVQIKKLNGKEETAFTVQYDFVMPKRFELDYVDKKGNLSHPVVIHRSSIGAIERTMAFLIEKYKGNFPTWLNPVQVKILPISNRHLTFAKKVKESLDNHKIRTELDERNSTLPAKIRDAQLEKVSYMAVLGDKEVKNKTITVRKRNGEDLGEMNVELFKKNIGEEIDKRLL